jgi:hypothetical protein
MVEFSNRESLLAWAAGLFDGEGTIYISKARIRASVHMTDLDILETFRSNFGGFIHPQKKQKEHHKKSWRWSLQASDKAMSFLTDILPFLHARRSKRVAEAISCYSLAMQERKSKQNKVKEVREKIRELGKTDMTHKDISILFHVDRSYVSHVLNGSYV